jgi:hypothetical protein
MKILNNNGPIKMFKKRENKFTLKSFLILKFGFFGFFFKTNMNFEFIYISFFKKFFKILSKNNIKI